MGDSNVSEREGLSACARRQDITSIYALARQVSAGMA